MLVGELPLSGAMFGQPLRPLRLLDRDWLRRWFAETQMCGKFLGGNFCSGFDHKPQRITLHAGVFMVGVINTPKPVSRLRCQSWRPVHAASEHDAAFGIVLITHKLRPRVRRDLLHRCGLKIGTEIYGNRDIVSRDLISRKLTIPNAELIFFIRQALRAGFTIEEIFGLTKIDRWFLVQIKEIMDFEEELANTAA